MWRVTIELTVLFLIYCVYILCCSELEHDEDCNRNLTAISFSR